MQAIAKTIKKTAFKCKGYLGPASRSEDQKDNSAHHGCYADDWGKRDGVLALGFGMEGADIHERFLLGIGNALIGEGCDAENYQN